MEIIIDLNLDVTEDSQAGGTTKKRLMLFKIESGG